MVTVIGKNAYSEDLSKPVVVLAANSDDTLPTTLIGNGSMAFVASSDGVTLKMFDEENGEWR